nr:hypothetical protein CFP56_26027 [Quercus suber]
MAGLGFLINLAGIFVPLGVELGHSPSQKPSTSVAIIAGSGDPTTGGNVPHIAIWDDNGARVGQYHPKKKEKLRPGESPEFPFQVTNDQEAGPDADPYYIMLSNPKHDAVCISAVTVSNSKVSATFFGDTGYTCGQSWFLSQNAIGTNFQKPKCVWLDGDHSNNINACALSFHLNDMAPATDKITEYQDDIDTLCKSTPRFSFWGNLQPDGVIPFFNPPLQYSLDSADGGQGADVDASLVIDKPNQYDKSVFFQQGEHKPNTRRVARRSNTTVSSANHNPEHLIITNHPYDDIREVCEHPNSYGWDIMSTVQKLYCDMEIKQLYHVCDGKRFKDDCFDSDSKSIVPKHGVHLRNELASSLPVKSYTTVDHWQ